MFSFYISVCLSSCSASFLVPRRWGCGLPAEKCRLIFLIQLMSPLFLSRQGRVCEAVLHQVNEAEGDAQPPKEPFSSYLQFLKTNKCSSAFLLKVFSKVKYSQFAVGYKELSKRKKRVDLILRKRVLDLAWWVHMCVPRQSLGSMRMKPVTPKLFRTLQEGWVGVDPRSQVECCSVRRSMHAFC